MLTVVELVKLPPLGVMVGVAVVGKTAEVTLRVNPVVRLMPPPVEVTVTGKLPVGVVVPVWIRRTVEQVGLHVPAEKFAEAPVGSADAVKITP